MKRATAAATVRVHRNAAAESRWQEWISGPLMAEATPENSSPVTAVNGSPQPSREAIARLAYAIWEERGCPVGSGEEDWLRAEKQLLEKNNPK